MKNCTIIIITWNRPEYVKRLLNYYDKKENGDLVFLVLDSSTQANKNINRENIARFSNINVEYHEYPEETTPVNKCLDGLKKTKTDFCVFCADDDFVVPGAVRSAVLFLQDHGEFSAVNGSYISFHDRGGKFYWKPVYTKQSITGEKPSRRILEHLKNYKPTAYAVHRTGILKKATEETIKSGADHVLLGELLVSVLTAIYGKIHDQDVFQGARQEGSPWHVQNKGPKLPIIWYSKGTEKYDTEYAKFKNCLKENLIFAGENENFDSLIDSGVADYVRANYTPTYSQIMTSNAKEAFGNAKIPSAVRTAIQYAYRKIKPLHRGGQTGDFSGTAYEPSNTDFISIREAVLKGSHGK